MNMRPLNYDLRRMRAQRMTAMLMQEIGPLIDHSNDREVHNAIYELLWRSGADIITDMDRRDAGLPDRGNAGYTADELQILENRRLELMLSPSPIFVHQKQTMDHTIE